MVLDTQQGVFKHYNQRNNHIDDLLADFQVPIKDIQDVCLSSRLGEKNVFTVETKESSMVYYCEYADMTIEWHKKILEALNFFHLFLYDPANRAARLIHDENKVIRTEPHHNHEEPSTSGEELITENSFENFEEIGAGAFGKVYRANKKDTKEVYALKVLRKATLKSKNQLKYAISECRTLKNIHHPYIIPMQWAFQTSTHIYMVMEYCPFGDLACVMKSFTKLTENTARIYISEIILAIEYLHSVNIVYRDLKPSNILLDKNGHIRLADFSLAKENVTQDNPAMSFCGTPAYLPPELLNHSGAYKPADIYCLGVNLYEMITGTLPFITQDIGALYRAIATSRLKFPSGVSDEAKDLIQSLMNRNPEHRPNIQKVKEHKFFRDIDWDFFYNRSITPPISVEELERISKEDSESDKEIEESIL